MKAKGIILHCLICTFLAASVPAQETGAPLGKGNVAVKLDYISFTDSYFDATENDGVYFGIEGYGRIAPDLYLGGAVGQGVNVEMLGEEIDFIPIELNLKYANEISANVIVDVGAGLSCSSVEIRQSIPFPGSDETRDEWLFGGQVFADLIYKIGRISIGLNGKFQITEEFGSEDFNLNNYRLGVQLGTVF